MSALQAVLQAQGNNDLCVYYVLSSVLCILTYIVSSGSPNKEQSYHPHYFPFIMCVYLASLLFQTHSQGKGTEPQEVHKMSGIEIHVNNHNTKK